MKFLKIMLWFVIAAVVGVLSARNWRDVTLDLWGDLQLDIKIPLLLLITFLIGFVPAWLIYRGRLWRMTRRTIVPPALLPAVEADEEQER